MSRRNNSDRGRCIYCSRVTSTPAKVVYEEGSGGASARYSHHRRVALLNGIEVLPLCESGRRSRQ